jgi:PAS domain S-box-containing protein
MKKTIFKKTFTGFLPILLLLWIITLIFPQAITAQIRNMHFKHLTTDDGLSQSWVHSVIQDKYGFIWMASEDGLNRYDGNSFRIYKNNYRDQYSISNNGILTLFENSKGDLWIGTRKGLNLYDRKNDRFNRYTRWSERITTIAEDKNKILWVGTESGLYSLDLKNDSINTYNIPGDLSRNNVSRIGEQTLKVYKICIDKRDNIWIGSSLGLHFYDREDNSFINYYHDEKNPKSISGDDIRAILEDNEGRLWIGTSAGLDLFVNHQEHSPKGRFIHYQNIIDDKKSISKGPIMALFEDDKHNLYIGIQNGGLDVLDLKTYNENAAIFNHFKNDPKKENSLSNNSIYSITQDIQGNIWISTFGKGLNIINPLGDRFIHYRSESGDQNSLNNNQVNTFLEDNDFLWIGTEGGLNRYNKKEDKFKHYVHNPLDKRSIGSNAVWAICKDRRENLWIGTWGGGLNRFDYKTETFEHYYNDPKDTNSISSNNMFSIYEDSRGNLWIGTMGGGLNMFDYKKNRFIRYTASNSNLYTEYVPSIIETKSGDLWLSNENSFERFNTNTKEFENFIYSDNDSTSLSSNKAISILEDSKGNLWMGTDAGLNLFNNATKGFKCYRIEDGLPDNCINGIVEDNYGNLWLSTDKGLSKFINAINLPVKPEFRNYGYEDGLQGNEFCPRSCCKGADGKLYFGGPNGFNVFDPDKIIENTYIPPIVITGLNIFNKPELLGERGINKDLDSTEDIVLSYKQSVFSFEFAALNYISSYKNQYAYKLEGFENDWNYVGTKHTATYTNLDPGKYIFRVKGSNNDGVWNEKGVALPIIITPPFWKTIWFYGLLIIITGIIVYQIYKWRVQIRNLAEEKKIEEAIAKERNLLRALIDNVPDRIYVKDIECRFIIFNTAVGRKLGIEKSEQIIGKTDFDFYPPELAAGYHNDDQMVIESGQPLFNREEPSVDSVGNRKWTLTTKIPLRNSQGQIIGLVGIGSDITERKQIEEALAKERNLLRTLINNLPDGIYVKDKECRKVLVNPVDVCNLGCKSESEVIGKTDFDIYPKELAEGFYADDQKVIQTGQSVIDKEEYVIDAKGQKIWLLTTKLPLRDENNQITGLIGIGRDITARKITEEALKQKTALLEAQLNSSIDGVLVVDKEGRKILQNKRTVELWKIPQEIADNPNDQQQVSHVMNATKNPEQFVNQVKYLYSHPDETSNDEIELKDGTILDRYSAPVIGNDEQSYGRIWSFRDITARKKVEEALKQKTALLEAQLNSSIDGILVTDKEGRKILNNQRTLELWKIPHEIADIPDDQQQVNYVMNYAKNPEQFASQVNYLYSHPDETSSDEIELKDGTILDRYSAPVIGSDGRNYGRIWSFRDITERKRAEKEREKLISELKEALADVKLLSGLVPICASCKKIRDDQGYWTQIESYIQDRSDAKFSHSICPDCAEKLYPGYNIKK